jgi:hypothetical protein
LPFSSLEPCVIIFLMTKTLREGLTFLTILLLVAPFLFAGDHLVSSAELHQQLLGAAQARQSDTAKIERFLSYEPVQKVMKATGMDESKVRQAVSMLSDEELARLAARANKVENDFAAGALNNQEITYILIALGTAVVILVIVAAR